MRIYIAEFDGSNIKDRALVEDLEAFIFDDRTDFYQTCADSGLVVSELWTLQEFTKRLNDDIYPESTWVAAIKTIK